MSLGAVAGLGVADHEADDFRLLVARVAGSERFGRAPRLREFLLYVAECTLEHRLSEVREQVIAERVFGRKQDGVGQDTIVRAEARNLRKRLEAYFSNEGAGERTTIVMPKGGYALAFVTRAPASQTPPFSETDKKEVPAFVVTDSVASNHPLPPVMVDSAKPRVVDRSTWPWILLLSLATLLFAVTAAYWFLTARSLDRDQHPEAASLYPYASLFNTDRQTYIVTSDTGFLQIAAALHRRLSLDEYMSRNYGPQPATNPPDLLTNWNIYEYTDGREMTVANLLLRQNIRFAHQVSLLSGHSVQIGDFKDKNIVLIGSPISNPWAQLFEDSLNFRCDLAAGGRIVFRNTVPKEGESSQLPSSEDIAHHRTYARVAFLPPHNGSPAILLIAGTTAQATQTAGELSADPAWLARVLQSMNLQPRGEPRFFELLIRLENFVGGAISPEIAAWRTTAAPDH